MFNSDNLRLDGKCAIITGAGAGIGKEIAITFATAGASVVVSDINADAANHVVDEIQQLGGQAFACRCDITSEQELSALADFAVSKLGKVDILVNNAGGGGPKPFDMPMADFRRAYELNVVSLAAFTDATPTTLDDIPVTWASTPARELGTTLADRMMQKITHEETHSRNLIIPARLIAAK